MNITIDKKAITDKLSESVLESGWDFVSDYIQDDFLKVLDQLIVNVQEGKRFTPKVRDIFNAFTYCPKDKLKVVMVGQDPYPQLNVADGLAFSCSKTISPQPSLKFMFKELPDQENKNTDPDLKRWAKQGVLLINSAFTVEINKIGSHYDMWNSFSSSLIKYLDNNFNDIVFVFLGRQAQQRVSLINKTGDNINRIITVSHPASAAYHGGNWNSNDMYNNINTYLESVGKTKIVW